MTATAIQMTAPFPRKDLADVPGEFTTWIVLSAGEGHRECSSKEDALAIAKDQAAEIPNLVLAIYRLEHLVSARVKKPRVFAAPIEQAA